MHAYYASYSFTEIIAQPMRAIIQFNLEQIQKFQWVIVTRGGILASKLISNTHCDNNRGLLEFGWTSKLICTAV